MQPMQPPHTARLGSARIAWREAGQGPCALVLLHGIGSGAASWQGQLDGLGGRFRVLAWDAPGYGDSTPLNEDHPLASHYAEVLSAWLERLQVRELVLLGHSLGALIAAHWATQPTVRLRALVLASPARGYGTQAPELRQAKWRERVEAIERLGPQGLADARAAALCAPGASAAVVAQVRDNMARVTPRGYGQAAHLLAHGDLLASLRSVSAPVAVLCGELDRVTPPEACAEVAAAAGVPLTRLEGVAHASYVEAPQRFNDALRAALPGLDGEPT